MSIEHEYGGSFLNVLHQVVQENAAVSEYCKGT